MIPLIVTGSLTYLFVALFASAKLTNRWHDLFMGIMFGFMWPATFLGIGLAQLVSKLAALDASKKRAKTNLPKARVL